MKRILAIFLSLAALAPEAHAGLDTTRRKPDIRRAKLHDDIDRLQLRVLASDGRADGEILIPSQEDVSLLLTDIFTRKVDELQDTLEYTATVDHRLKVKYLAGLEGLLAGYVDKYNRSMPPEHGALLFRAYTQLVQADVAGRSVAPLIDLYPYEIGEILISHPASVFFENKGYEDARVVMFRKFSRAHPDKVMPLLEEYHYVPFIDSLIVVSAHRNPNQFYDYAAASQTRLGQRIRQSSDSLVRTITALSESRGGRLCFPFLDEIMSGRLTPEAIQRTAADSLQYFRLLVRTQIRNVERMRMRDTPLSSLELPRMLKRRAEEVFIHRINALHDEPDAVRFRILEPFTPQELYYLIVMGEDIIYTSSYRGVYNRMMERTPGSSGDGLLVTVRFDRFKKFIKMAAGYNRLDHFLSSMPDSNAQRLMIAFARGLDKTESLEEAVDVADSYGSINTPSVKLLIDREISNSLRQSEASGRMRSTAIYRILQTIFRSSTDPGLDVSSLLGIPPVYKLEHRSLTDTAGRVVQLVFFYGDDDGKQSFSNFMGLFSGKPEWSVNRGEEWVEIRSVKGSKVWIYANLPLDNAQGDDPDAKAQAHLLRHLSAKGLKPTVVIHRGHSYHLKYTLRQLPYSARIVVLGSCGGYHNLDDVLNRCPDAHIVSSKEVGTQTVNEPILRSINEDLRTGRDVEWIPMWKSLAAQFPGGDARERFENYIPPHRNLGALFIKAYRKAMHED